jgi:hypothetical protein
VLDSRGWASEVAGALAETAMAVCAGTDREGAKRETVIPTIAANPRVPMTHPARRNGAVASEALVAHGIVGLVPSTRVMSFADPLAGDVALGPSGASGGWTGDDESLSIAATWSAR